MQIAVVVNPTSGRRKGEQIAREAVASLRAHGHQVDELRGETAHDAHGRLKARIETGPQLDLVAVVGGDGALHELLPTLHASRITAAMIPAGTGNDVARHLGVREPRTAVEAIHAHRTKTIDLIKADEVLVATVVASGFDSKVNERANAMTWPRGNLRYNLAILKELREFEPLTFTLEADGQHYERRAMLVAVANLPSFGGGLRIGEGAEDDDGLLDVVVIHPVSKLKLVRVFPMLYRGTHIHLPEFERIRAKRVTWAAEGIVAYGDGERLGPLPVTAEVVPRALTMIASDA
ncbi:MAG TPA: diacylglycerol kinase family protein [Aeromicrobium sp.]|nr:diacylglycerol kinase family protein [Aeromicrobium sp.]HKY56787.1 diacylglycerol kinase family protein [Aeromicrobium sp.]